jgi:uncharacterized protein with gpF-like domain
MAATVLTLDPLPSTLPQPAAAEEFYAHWKRVERTRLAWYGRETRRVAQHFAREGAAVADAVARSHADGGAVAMAEMAINHSARAWAPLLAALYDEVALDFARKVDAGLKHAPGPDAAKAEDTPADLWRGFVAAWLEGGEAAKKVVGITETTRREVAKALEAGLAAGESVPQLARRVRSVYEGFTTTRAVTIARTETIAASNLGSRAGALHSGLQLEHFWIATSDRRTREWHDAVDGQTQPMDEPYVVRGERLMFPGDGSLGASARNLVMCRCVEGYRAIR